MISVSPSNVEGTSAITLWLRDTPATTGRHHWSNHYGNLLWICINICFNNRSWTYDFFFIFFIEIIYIYNLKLWNANTKEPPSQHLISNIHLLWEAVATMRKILNKTCPLLLPGPRSGQHRISSGILAYAVTGKVSNRFRKIQILFSFLFKIYILLILYIYIYIYISLLRPELLQTLHPNKKPSLINISSDGSS